MFSYISGVVITFICLGVIFNFIKNFDPQWYYKDDEFLYWVGCVVASVFWFIFIPVSLVILVIYLLKLLTDLIAKGILKIINKRKLKKESKDV